MRYLFEDYALDTDRRELCRGSALLTIEPQVFDVLAFLVKNRDRVVSKDDLLVSVWDGRIVSESTIASRINAARRIIGDSGEQQRLIRTIIGKGIRFIGVVQQQADADPAIPAAAPPLSIVVLPGAGPGLNPGTRRSGPRVVRQYSLGVEQFCSRRQSAGRRVATPGNRA